MLDYCVFKALSVLLSLTIRFSRLTNCLFIRLLSLVDFSQILLMRSFSPFFFYCGTRAHIPYEFNLVTAQQAELVSPLTSILQQEMQALRARRG